MKKICTLLLGLLGYAVTAQNYSDHQGLSQRLQSISSTHKNLTNLKSIGKSTGGRDLWLLTIGKNSPDTKPAIVLIANVEGYHLAGSEIALQTIEKLLKTATSDSLSKLLDSRTIYLLASANPDAAAQYFSKLKFERSGNGSVTDDDRDGRKDEDGYDDLNGDGVISMLRVEDPTGNMMASKTDPRILVKADPTKGEVGKYMVYSEGTDNDKDGVLNEDGEGGVHINKNFTFDYEPFKPGTGDIPVSELENRSFIDWLYTRKNIYAIFTFGPANNLTEAKKFDPASANTRIIKGWQQKDVSVNEQVTKLYSNAGLKDAPSLPNTKGDFPSYAYFHFGKLSFSTQGWWMPKDSTKSKPATPPVPVVAPASGAAAARMGAGKGPETNDGQADADFLKWAKANNISAFTEWKEYPNHPDFPGKKVEIGGLIPFAKLNPPTNFLASSADKHFGFFYEFMKIMPDVEIVNVKQESVSDGLTRVTVDIHNKGLLPTHAEIANRVKYEDRLKVSVTTNGKILSGRANTLMRAGIAGNGVETMSWLIAGTGNVTITAGSSPAGSAKVTLNLK